METSRFDRFTRELAAVTSRRGALKLFAGTAFALGATSAFAPSSRAGTCVEANGECTIDDDCCGRLTCGDGICGGPSAGCAPQGDECTVNEDCCDGFYCNDDGICSAAAECAGDGGGCDADEVCCGRLTCGEDRTCGGPSAGPECSVDDECAVDEICCGAVCAQIECCIEDEDPNARCAGRTACFEGYCDETGGTVVLPNTGAGSVHEDHTSWLLGAAAIGGAAALSAARRRSSRDHIA